MDVDTYDRKPETNGKADVSPVDFFLIYLWHITLKINDKR